MIVVEVNVANPMRTRVRAKRSFFIVILNQGFKIPGPQQNIKISCSTYLSNFAELAIDSVVEWLRRRAHDQHGLGSKTTRAILLCRWERHFTALFPCLVVLASSSKLSRISIKLQADSNILVSPEAGRGNCLPYVLAPPSLSCESGG